MSAIREAMGEMYVDSLKRSRLYLEILEGFLNDCRWWQWRRRAKIQALKSKKLLAHADLLRRADRNLEPVLGDPLWDKVRDAAIGTGK